MTSGSKATDPTIYGDYTNAYVLNKGDIVEIILNNNDAGKHPFHLHGHNFQAIWRADPNSGFYNPVNETKFPAKPMRRDVFMVRPNGNFVVRFRSDNPGE
jgi:iron transport multicopper oxidase